MSELQTIEAYIHALEEKIDAWFHRHFGALTPETEAHKVAVAAHTDLKAVVGITPPASASASAAVAPAPQTATPVS